MEEDTPVQESRFPRWAMIAGIVVIFLCLAVLITAFLARTKLLTVAMRMVSTETATPSATVTPTATFTLGPTDTPTVEPTITGTASPTPIPMPPLEIMAISQGAPVLDEQFVDNSRNWVGADAVSEMTIQEQQLQLRSAEANKGAVAFCQGDCGPYQDFYYYQAEMVEDRPSTIGLGMIFGMNQQKTAFYVFRIRPSSAEYSLGKVLNGQLQALIDWTASPAIRFYPFVNIVGASYREGNIELYINGQKVAIYTDKQPYKSGRIGFSVDTDGVRLLASKVLVLSLAPVTPAPAITQVSPQGSPVYQSPTPGLKYTPTPTTPGSCPSSVPSGSFVLVVFKSSNQKGSFTINGSNVKVNQGPNVYYLPLNKGHVVKIGEKVYELYYTECKIVNLKMP